MEKARSKFADYTPWFGCIIGLFVGLSKADGYTNKYEIMAAIGVINGVVLGLILGLIIDKIRESAAVAAITTKVNDIQEQQELVKRTKASSVEYNEAKHRYQFLSNATLTEKFEEYKTADVSNMQRLALEEELVKRGVLEYSPMHEKLDKLNTLFKGNG